MRQAIDWTDVRLLVHGAGDPLHDEFLKRAVNEIEDDAVLKSVAMMTNIMGLSGASLDVLESLKEKVSEAVGKNSITKLVHLSVFVLCLGL